MNVPTYDLPQSPILIIGFFGILFTLVLLYFVNRAYFESPLVIENDQGTNKTKEKTIIKLMEHGY